MDSNIDNNSLKYEQTAKNNKKHHETLIFKVGCVIILLDFYIYLYCAEVKTMSENINEKWISIEEAAEHLGIKPVTVRDWIKKGKGIPAHKIGKKWKFKYSELDAWVKSGQSAIE